MEKEHDKVPNNEYLPIVHKYRSKKYLVQTEEEEKSSSTERIGDIESQLKYNQNLLERKLEKLERSFGEQWREIDRKEDFIVKIIKMVSKNSMDIGEDTGHLKEFLTKIDYDIKRLERRLLKRQLIRSDASKESDSLNSKYIKIYFHRLTFISGRRKLMMSQKKAVPFLGLCKRQHPVEIKKSAKCLKTSSKRYFDGIRSLVVRCIAQERKKKEIN